MHGALAEATDPERRPRSPRLAPRAGRAGPRTRRSPPSSSARPAARRPAAASRRPPRSWSARPTLTPDPARRAARARSRPRRPSSTPARSTRRSSCSPPREAGPLDELQARAACERLRAQIAFAAAPRRRRRRRCCCDAAHARSSRSTRRWRARPTSRRSARRSSPAGWRAPALRRASPRPPARAPRPEPPARRATCCSTASRSRFTEGYAAGGAGAAGARSSAFSPRATRRGRRLRGSGWRRRVAAVDAVGRRGLARAGHPPACSSPATPARSASCRSRSTSAPAVACTPASFAAAAALIEEADAITAATGTAPLGLRRAGARRLARRRSRGAGADRRRHRATRPPAARGGRRPAPSYATAVLYNGLGRYDDALAAARRGVRARRPRRRATGRSSSWSRRPSRTGERRGRRATPCERLEERTRASGTDWALGIEARSRALLSEGEAAERALPRGDRAARRARALASELARAHLLYGEWLRRESRRRRRARAAAHAPTRCSPRSAPTAFAERARRELLATGETVRKRTRRDARRAHRRRRRRSPGSPATGARTRRSARELFISPRTVEWHLRKVFTKLGISSRKGLRDALSDARTAVPA